MTIISQLKYLNFSLY